MQSGPHINFKAVVDVIGVLILITGLLIFTCLPFSFYYGGSDFWPLFISAGVTSTIGLFLWKYKQQINPSIMKREGYLIVALGWLTLSLVSAIPYMATGVCDSWTDAFFESISGLTTTGASIFTDIEALPKGILFWRSLTQWIGGMGIIVLTVAIFPLLGIGGVELFVAEAPGPTSDKIHPRIRETAKRLWLIYVFLTAILSTIFWLLGMTPYDAINHGLTTMATGGYSTKNNSMAYFSPSIQYVTTVFMFIAGTNYTVIYLSLKGRFKSVWRVEEFRFYLSLVLIIGFFMFLSLWTQEGLPAEQAFRDGFFQVLSLMSTTGFVSTDYSQWGPVLVMLCFLLLFMGACAGSTSGGIKIVRHLAFLKNSVLEFKRLLHPRAEIPLRINNHIVQDSVKTHILVFLVFYFFLFVMGTLFVSFCGIDFKTSLGAVATSLGNVGPGIGSVGSVDNFAWLPDSVKSFLAFLMLLGRLELFAILILFSPYFWRVN